MSESIEDIDQEIFEHMYSIIKSLRIVVESLHKQVTLLDEVVWALNTQDENLLKLIAHFHDINLDDFAVGEEQ